MHKTIACAVDGCDRRRQSAEGYCTAHWKRWRRNGSPGPAEIQRRNPGAICAVDHCETPVGKQGSRGFCQKHGYRFRQHGDPLKVIHQRDRNIPRKRGPEHTGWQGDDIGYIAAHDRVRALLGSASDHPCIDCGGRAKDWSYAYGAPNERMDSRHVPYSPDPSYYFPRCRSCHKKHDIAVANVGDALLEDWVAAR